MRTLCTNGHHIKSIENRNFDGNCLCGAPQMTLPNQFEKDLSTLINSYTKSGLKKPDLVSKMKWMTTNCEKS